MVSIGNQIEKTLNFNNQTEYHIHYDIKVMKNRG